MVVRPFKFKQITHPLITLIIFLLFKEKIGIITYYSLNYSLDLTANYFSRKLCLKSCIDQLVCVLQHGMAWVWDELILMHYLRTESLLLGSLFWLLSVVCFFLLPAENLVLQAQNLSGRQVRSPSHQMGLVAAITRPRNNLEFVLGLAWTRRKWKSTKWRMKWASFNSGFLHFAALLI